MSSTAQKQDMSDPDVVAAFAERVGTERRLVALYLLTVADIRGTSPKVWNAWKAQLLEDLFHATRARARRRAGVASRLPTACSRGSAKRSGCCASTRCRTAPSARCGGARHRLLPAPHGRRDRLARAASLLARRTRAPVVKARLSRSEAGLQVLVYLPDQKDLFARICGFFGRRGLVDPRSEDPHDAARLRARHVHGPRSRAMPTASYRDAIQIIELELAQVLKEQRPLEPPTVGPREPASAPLSAHARGAASFPTTRARTSSSRSSPATAPGSSRRSRTRSPRPTSTSSARRSTRWASAPRTCSSSTARGCTTSTRCCASKPRSTSTCGSEQRRRSSRTSARHYSSSGALSGKMMSV